jgi:Fe-S-cluster containining protein
MERFRAALLDPQIAIDWWEGDPRGCDVDEEDELPVGYFLRPAIVGVTRKFHAAWGGRCVFLGDTGCKLPHDERPHGCRALEPRADGNCVCHDGSKHGAAMAWLPYFDTIDADQCEEEQVT